MKQEGFPEHQTGQGNVRKTLGHYVGSAGQVAQEGMAILEQCELTDPEVQSQLLRVPKSVLVRLRQARDLLETTLEVCVLLTPDGEPHPNYLLRD